MTATFFAEIHYAYHLHTSYDNYIKAYAVDIWGGHLGRDKTLTIVEDCIFWPRLMVDIARICELCRACQLVKGQKKNLGLYKLLPIPREPWQDLSIDFFLGLTKNNTKSGLYLCCGG